MAKVLLVNPSYKNTYSGSKASLSNPVFPTLSLATLAASARKHGHQIEIYDLCWRTYNPTDFRQKILQVKPDIVGLTILTPSMNQARDMSLIIKEISSSMAIVAGGAHVSSIPEESLRESHIDVIVRGEGDLAFPEICDGRPWKEIKGLYYRSGEEIFFTGDRPPIHNLDDLPMPAWDLFDLKLYSRQISRLFARKVPFVTAEFSRGCIYSCDFCASKQTMAMGYRKKSPERCASEVEYMGKLGIKEFMLTDDIFTTDSNWANQVSLKIAEKKTGIIWSCTNGIRVESAKSDLFQNMKKAGCYRVSFGFESGNDQVLKKFGKGGKASLEMGTQAVRLARQAGLDACGYFILGLSADSSSTMDETIEYASSLPLDMIKFAVAIAFPGTPMFREYTSLKIIKTFNWDLYNTYSKDQLFTHPVLSHVEIQDKMKEAYRKAVIFNPSFWWRRLVHGIRTREILWDMFNFFRFLFMPETNSQENHYYATERWPKWDYFNHPPLYRPPLRVRSSVKAITIPPEEKFLNLDSPHRNSRMAAIEDLRRY